MSAARRRIHAQIASAEWTLSAHFGLYDTH
jgi:hypothetical protein